MTKHLYQIEGIQSTTGSWFVGYYVSKDAAGMINTLRKMGYNPRSITDKGQVNSQMGEGILGMRYFGEPLLCNILCR